MKILVFILSVLTTIAAYAGGSNCSLRSNALEENIARVTSSMSGVSRILCEQEMRSFANGRSNRETVMSVCSNTRDVVHFRRNNAMRPVDITAQTAEGRAGRAMGKVISRAGVSEVLQVCPGVYLAAAHGVLDSPIDAVEQGRDHRAISEQRVKLFSYPVSEETQMQVDSGMNFISPLVESGEDWLKPGGAVVSSDHSKWRDPRNDFVFIRAENPNNPDDFLQPVSASSADLIKASEVDRTVDLQHFRSLSIRGKNPDGSPNELNAELATSWDGLQELFQTPYVVEERCVVTSSSHNMLGSDCPVEPGVSGSAMIAIPEGSDVPLLVAAANNETIHNGGLIDRLTPENSNQFLQSEHFCSYYETACPSKKCADFNAVVPQPEQSASLRDISL